MSTNKRSKEKDSGLALVLILLIAALYLKTFALIIPACIVLILSMTIPVLFKPFATVWYSVSGLLGKISTTLILAFLFFILIVPVGLIRRLFNNDSLQVNAWNTNPDSAFRECYHKYDKTDLENPY